FQAEDGIRDGHVTGVQTCALPICVADASGAERCVAGMEVADRIQRTWGFRFPVPSLQREEAAGPCRGSQKEDPTGFCERRHPRRSEERRVGKECRSRMSRAEYKTK